MKAIVKTLTLATKYKEWHDGLEKDNHPEYNSSSNKHYYSIVANLLHLQKGVCAYTEIFLCSQETVAADKWVDGSFSKFDTFGQLDHFDPRLKDNNAWLWDNFFVIHTDINIKEKRANIITHLKPDAPDFTLSDYLVYNLANHYFHPRIDLSDDMQQSLLNDIDYLGLNHGTVVDMRKMMLMPLLTKVRYNALSKEEAKEQLFQFFTAYEMAVEQVLALDN